MYPDCPYHAEWNPGMPAGIAVGGGMPGPSVLVNARGVGDGAGVGGGEGDGVGGDVKCGGDADGAAVAAVVGVDPSCVSPARQQATTRAWPSNAPADATPY